MNTASATHPAAFRLGWGIAATLALASPFPATGTPPSWQAAGLPAPDAPVPAVSSHPHLTVHGADADQRARLELAVARFVDHGLALPDLHVRLADDEQACDGHKGLFRSGPRPWQVLICSDLAFVYEHELAHAWLRAGLTNEQRRAYMRQQGFTLWGYGSAAPRDQLAMEDAAFVVQQALGVGLAGGRSPVHQRRREAFQLLTAHAGTGHDGLMPRSVGQRSGSVAASMGGRSARRGVPVVARSRRERPLDQHRAHAIAADLGR